MMPNQDNISAIAMHFNRLTLAFNGRHAQLEPHFQDYYYLNTLNQIRIAIGAAFIFYGLFGIMDAIVMPDRYHIFWIIRWAVVCPCILGVFLFSFSRLAVRFLQPVVSLGTLICGLGIIAMTQLATAGHSYGYVGGLVQIVFFIFTFARLRFIWATAVTWVLIISFLAVALYFGSAPRNQIIGNVFHLSLIGLMGMMAGYAIEFHTRRNFFLSRQLESKKRRLHIANQFLEERVAKRTIELHNTNNLLKTKIKEGKVIEAALRDSQQRFQNIFETAAGGMIIVNGWNNQVVEVNPAAAKMAADSHENLKGRDLGTLIRPAAAEDGSTLPLPTPHPVECLLTRCRNEPLPILTSARETEFNGRSHWIISFGDIQKIKEAEAAKRELEIRSNQVQHLQAVGTLAGGIAHDFNNILFGMLGYTELALEDAEEGSMLAKNLKEILRGGHRAKELIHQILTFSRQDSVEKRPVMLTPLIKEALKLLRATIPATIGIQTRFAPGLPNVEANPTHIHQIIMNLCTNAAQAIGNRTGCIRITLDIKSLLPGDQVPNSALTCGDYVRILIEDDGEGIPSELIDRIFEPFFTTKSQGHGTGMGLSVVHGIVQSHKGAISVQSHPGEGSQFEILLPPSLKAQRPDKAANIEAAKGSEQILFVDDEKALGLMMKRMLAGLGYGVTVCNHPAKALARFRAQPFAYDVVITDLTMPEMTGLELAENLLHTRPDLPILLCTGNGELTTGDRCQDLGIRELVYKPISKQELATAIRRALQPN